MESFNGKAAKTACSAFETENREIILPTEKDALDAVSYCDAVNQAIRILSAVCRGSEECSLCLLGQLRPDGSAECPLTSAVPALWARFYDFEKER